MCTAYWAAPARSANDFADVRIIWIETKQNKNECWTIFDRNIHINWKNLGPNAKPKKKSGDSRPQDTMCSAHNHCQCTPTSKIGLRHLRITPNFFVQRLPIESPHNFHLHQPWLKAPQQRCNEKRMRSAASNYDLFEIKVTASVLMAFPPCVCGTHKIFPSRAFCFTTSKQNTRQTKNVW